MGSVSLRYAPQGEIGPGNEMQRNYRLYFGPKVESDVSAVDARLEPSLVVGYGWVRPVTKLFAYLLNWLHDHVWANYGIGKGSMIREADGYWYMVFEAFGGAGGQCDRSSRQSRDSARPKQRYQKHVE